MFLGRTVFTLARFVLCQKRFLILQANEADTGNLLLMDPCIVEHAERDWLYLMQPYLLRRNDIIDIKYLKKRAISFRLFFQCACDRICASISFGIVGLSRVHYDAAVAATAATAACNLEAENRENRRVKMKRGSSQGKWGNAFPRCISI